MLDFLNDTDTITEAFSNYYRTTVLADETDPNKLHDLQGDLDGAQVYSLDQVTEFVKRYLEGVDRDQLDPILDRCVAVYMQGAGRGRARSPSRARPRGSCAPTPSSPRSSPTTTRAGRSARIFLNFLIPKLPSPMEEDLSKGVLEVRSTWIATGSRSARMQKIILEDEDAEIDPVPGGGAGGKGEVEIDRLSVIIEQFNDLFGGISWADADRVRPDDYGGRFPARVAEDTAFKNARENSDRENARIEHDKALGRVMTSIMRDDTELFRQFVDNPDFKRWLGGVVFEVAYEGRDAA